MKLIDRITRTERLICVSQLDQRYPAENGELNGAGLTPDDVGFPLLEAHTTVWMFLAAFGFGARVILFNDTALAATMTLALDPLAFAITAGFHLTVSRLGVRIIGPRFAVLSLTFCIVAAIALAAIGGGILAGFGKTLPWRDGDVAAIPGAYYFAILVSWVSLYAWTMSWSRARAAETRRILAENNATRAELHRLRTQLDPHFLYNALNTIAAEIHDNPEVALDMTRNTAAFLRHNLEQHQHPVCSLGEEIDSLRTYLKIQEGRFELPFRMALDVSSSAAEHLLPRWTLQVLVENAFKHGSTSDLKLRISALSDDEGLVLQVKNKGQMIPGKTDTGIGLANLRRRLDLHFPSRHQLQLRPDKDDVVVELQLKGDPCFA